MKNLFLPSVLMLASTVSWSKAPPQNPKSMTSLMQEVRDPFYDSAKRKQYLQLVQTQMQLRLAKELKTNQAGLANKFIENPKNNDLLWSDPWIDLQTEFYTTLHQEILFQRWTAKTQNKKITDYGKNIAQSMVLHLGKYSGLKEGRLYSRWNTIAVKGKDKSTDYRIPYFVFSPTVQNLTALDAHAPYESVVAKDSEESMGNPGITNFLRNAGKKSRDQYQELAEKIQLNHRIYIRAVANSAKTVASIHYLTGEYSLAQAETKVQTFIGSYCEGCSTKEKSDYQQAAISYVKNTKKEFLQEYTPKTIVSSFCSELKNNGYHWADTTAPVKKKFDYYERPRPIAVDNTRVDKTNILNQMILVRVSAVKKAVTEHDLGVLFLTKALSQLSSNHEPMGTYLGCTPESEASDMGRVKAAINEARKNVEEYITRINEKVAASTYSIGEANNTLEYFTQTNVAASAEAVMTFPQGINHLIDSVVSLDSDVKRRKRIDTVVAWGGTIIGIGLAISGIGAPEGVAILLAVGAMAKGAVFGSYYIYRSHQEKVFYRELLMTKTGVGNNFYLNNNLSQHYSDYRNFRTQYIVEFAQSAMSFVKIHRLAMTKSGGDIVKAHGVIKKTFEHAKTVGGEVGEDQMYEMIINFVF